MKPTKEQLDAELDTACAPENNGGFWPSFDDVQNRALEIAAKHGLSVSFDEDDNAVWEIGE